MTHIPRTTAAGRAAAVLLAGIVAGACGGDPPTSPGARSGAAPSEKRELLPYKDVYDATGTMAPSSNCPAGNLLVSLEGGGNGTHVGRYTIVNSHCLDLATGVFTNGSFTKTAANGDQLFGTYSGTGTVIVPPAPVGRFAVQGTLTFTGGTGRFAGASGSTSMEGTQVTDFSQPGFPSEVHLQMEGTLSSVGSGS
jgi:hypothetical protein